MYVGDTERGVAVSGSSTVRSPRSRSSCRT